MQITDKDNMMIMKNIFKAMGIIPAAALLLMMHGCKSEKIEYVPTDGLSGGAVGYLVMDGFDLQVADYAEEITEENNDPDLSGAASASMTKAGSGASSTTEAPEEYVIRIRNIKTSEEQKMTYGELKQAESGQIPLAPGTYIVSAESSDYEEYMAGTSAASWEIPVYYGETTATIVSKKETTVSGIVCRLANLKTTVSVTPDLAGLFMPDSQCEAQGLEKLSVTLSVGEAADGNSLQYGRTEMDAVKAGYFKISGNSATVDVVLTGQYNTAAADAEPEYVPVNWKSSLPECKPGQWRKISIGLTNGADGNAKFEITVENWTYDKTVNVDVTKMYSFTEEIIDDEVSDENSPVLALAGGNIADGYTLHSGMYDDMLNKWTDNLRLTLTPSQDAVVESVTVEVSSDNGDFLSAVDALGVKKRTIEVYPDASALTGSLIVSDDAGVLSFVLNDGGMTKLFSYKGEHHLKVTAVDDRYRFSYTDLKITCLEGEVTVSGPEIVWTNSDGSVTYDFDREYTIDETLQVKINVSTESTFAGFNVVIDSDILTDEVLGAVGLSENLDLINPGSADEMLTNLGFPTGENVTSQTEVSFDISSFLTLIEDLASVGSTYCNFKLVVTDGNGTTEKTIRLKVQTAE